MQQPGTRPSFRDGIMRLLTQPELPDSLYYHLALVRQATGGFQWSIQTEWCGYTEGKPRREIREGSLYYGEEQRAWLIRQGQLALLINSDSDLAYFYGFGGHALILQSLAKRYFNRLIEPHVSLRDSSGLGFIGERSLDSSRLQRAPSKKLRMHILTRDGRRCLICGRAPAYYVDLELHVHHAIPWGSGGITEENLVTLCKTCHDGLEPHFDLGLVGLLRGKYPAVSIAYFDAIEEYQAWLKSQIELIAPPENEMDSNHHSDPERA